MVAAHGNDGERLLSTEPLHGPLFKMGQWGIINEFEDFRTKDGSNQGHNLALTVLVIPFEEVKSQTQFRASPKHEALDVRCGWHPYRGTSLIRNSLLP